MGFDLILTVGALALLGLGLTVAAALKGWQGWLELKKLELASAGPRADAASGAPGGRIELADLKERVRKLERIASGIDL